MKDPYVEVCKVLITQDQMENYKWLWNSKNKWNVHWLHTGTWIINEDDMLLSEGIVADFFF